jgi:hypothetical protein
MNDEDLATLPKFAFYKGAEDVLNSKDSSTFDWDKAAWKVRESLHDAMNARNVSFLFGSGCSSLFSNGVQVGIHTMAPLASQFLQSGLTGGSADYPTSLERTKLRELLGLDLESVEYSKNLERLMEVLFAFRQVIKHSSAPNFLSARPFIDSVIAKVTRYIRNSCTTGKFSSGDNTMVNLYQSFYRKLIFRDRTLPRPWIFTTNYDLFSETALDRLAIHYSNGFSGSVERRFNPATFRYALAEQLDVSSQRWAAVDSYVYLCKLHGSINWIEQGNSLFPISEVSMGSIAESAPLMIYPTPMKQSASFGAPYSDMFREFQNKIVRDQSVLFVVGYGFGDQHVNNIIFQALTVPTFRLVALVSPSTSGIVQKLRELRDPRVWLIGGDGDVSSRKAHYFETFVEKFMPEPPGNKVESAVARVLAELATFGESAGVKDEHSGRAS